ncbi:MAG TPA: hypothetical protein VFC19_45365 [Candidatus Limnocylindrales bacterium]|nr:hypothetical protein [Candidatus Limnocylindrales bacterium]
MGTVIRITVGGLATLMGLVWALQGLSLLPGTFMRDDPAWVVIGLVVAAAGVTLLFSGISRMRKTKT